MASTPPHYHTRCTRSRRFPRAAALGLVALGLGISLHLHAHHASHWWLPLVVLLVAHGAIISAVVWIVARVHGEHRDEMAHSSAGHESHDAVSKVVHTPRAYDWLVRILTLGGERKFRERILDLAGLRRGETVLDVGCGTGTLLIKAAERIGAVGSAQGIEASSELVTYARRKAKAQGVMVDIVEGSADHLPFPDASFDVVFCTMVLHHLPPVMQSAAVREMGRVMRPEGRIVIVDLERPQTISAAISLVTLFHRFGSRATSPSWQSIRQLLNQGGLGRLDMYQIWGGAIGVLVGRRQERVS